MNIQLYSCIVLKEARRTTQLKLLPIIITSSGQSVGETVEEVDGSQLILLSHLLQYY